MRKAVEDWTKDRLGQRRLQQVALARVMVRRVASPVRLLPDFLLIGTMRGGTSSLYKHLSFHPEVAASIRKEVSYFGRFYGQGEMWYRAHFPLAAERRWAQARGRKLLTFEATPSYLVEPHAPRRARALLPECKIIALLRDPVERAFSHYEHMVRLGLETRDFRTAIHEEASVVGAEFDRMTSDPSYYSVPYQRFSYVHRSLYAPQLERWCELFPAHQIMVMASEELYQAPSESWTRLTRFLDISDWAPDEFRNYSYTARRPARGVIDSDLRKSLEAVFAEDQDRIRRMVSDTCLVGHR